MNNIACSQTIAEVNDNNSFHTSPLIKNDRENLSLFYDEDKEADYDILQIGCLVAGSAAAVAATKFASPSLFKKLKTFLSKIDMPFTKVERDGISYRRGLFGKKYGLRLTSTEKYEQIKVPINNPQKNKVINQQATNLRNEIERCYENSRYDKILGILFGKPESFRRVGALPPNIVKRFKNPSEITRKVDEALSKFAREFHATPTEPKEGRIGDYTIPFPTTETLKKELSEILGTDVKISQLGGGKIGRTYRINILGEDMVLKVYYNKIANAFAGVHGNAPELLAAIKSSKLAPNKFAEFYMGKFGKNNDGYILTRFIPPQTQAETTASSAQQMSKFKFSDFLTKMSCDDLSADNMRNNIILDYGLTRTTQFTHLSPKAQKIARELFPILDGKHPEKIGKVAEKYKGTSELEEVKQYINFIIEMKYTSYNDLLVAKKESLAKLGLDFKPDIRFLLTRKCVLEKYSQDYGLTVQEFYKLREEYRARNPYKSSRKKVAI